MRSLISSLLAATAALVITSAVQAASPHAGRAHRAAAAPAFTRAADIPAPDGRWDFTSWDSEHGRLLVAHGKDVLIITPGNAATGQPVVRSIGDIQGAHAVLAIPGTNRILVSSGHDDSVRILDSDSGAQIASIAVAADPDAAVLSADGRTAYVMGAKAGAVSVIEIASLREVRRIPLKAGLEVAVLANGHLLAVNNEDASEIELADPVAGTALGTIALPGCEGPTGLAWSPETGLALSTCANGKAALVDLARRKLVELIPIGLGPDTAIWQADEHRFLVPCGKSGSLSVIRHGARGWHATATPTETSARTAALDPAKGRLFLPAARFRPTLAEKRAEIEPGSFHILVMVPVHGAATPPIADR